jgi:solute carrier family 13 (sodium-dependent dicarboxylate transporter), member 2/3/5
VPIVVASPRLAASAGRLDWSRFLGGVAGLIALAVLWYAPFGTTLAARHATAIAVATIVWWATAPVSHAWSGITALLLFWLTGTSSLAVVASGFWNSTTGFLLGALLIGTTVTTSGLARRLAFTFAARLGSSYTGLLLAFVVADFVLTFLIPSGIARVAILGAIVVGLAEAVGLSRTDPPARGLMLAVTCAASTFDKMVLAGTSSILASGIIEELGGVRVSYGLWFLAYVPCDVLTILGCWRIVAWLYPDRAAALDDCRAHFRRELAAMGALTPAERRATLLVGSAILLWLTDFAHGVRPATVALGVGALSLLPGIRMTGLRDVTRLPYGTLVFTATALGMSAVLHDSGALRILTDSMVGWMGTLVKGPTSSALVLYWGAFAYHLLLGAQNLLVTATLPPVVTLGIEHGYSPVVFGMIWIFGTAGKIFPYQSGVLMVGYAYGYFTPRDLLKVGFLLAVLESLILLLLVPIYWPLIGLL